MNTVIIRLYFPKSQIKYQNDSIFRSKISIVDLIPNIEKSKRKKNTKITFDQKKNKDYFLCIRIFLVSTFQLYSCFCSVLCSRSTFDVKCSDSLVFLLSIDDLFKFSSTCFSREKQKNE